MKRDLQHCFFRDFSSLNRYKKKKFKKSFEMILTCTFPFPLLSERGSYTVQAGLHLAMQLRIALNFGSSCLQTSHARIVYHKPSLAHIFDTYQHTFIGSLWLLCLFIFLTYFSYKENQIARSDTSKNFNSYYCHGGVIYQSLTF